MSAANYKLSGDPVDNNLYCVDLITNPTTAYSSCSQLGSPCTYSDSTSSWNFFFGSKSLETFGPKPWTVMFMFPARGPEYDGTARISPPGTPLRHMAFQGWGFRLSEHKLQGFRCRSHPTLLLGYGLPKVMRLPELKLLVLQAQVEG